METKKNNIDINKYFGQSFEINKLKIGDNFPIGGSIFNNKLNIFTIADFDYFKDFFETIKTSRNSEKNNTLKENLKIFFDLNSSIKLDFEIFYNLFVFTNKLFQEYKYTNEGISRQELYNNNNNQVKLSEIFKNYKAMCSEISMLSQFFLQENNIESSIFSGEILWDEKHDFAEKHTFITINIESENYIFDPSNPTKKDGGLFPSIFKINGDFYTEIKRNDKTFLECINILNGKKVFYGTGNGSNIRSDIHIIKNDVNNLIKKED